MNKKHSRNLRSVPLIAVGFLLASVPIPTIGQTSDLDRTSLPIREPEYPPYTILDARDAKAPPRFEIKAPKGAPNVVIVLLDDVGFGQSSAFGGPIKMSTLDKWRLMGCASPTFTPPRSARQLARRYSLGGITTSTTQGRSWKLQPPSQATRGFVR